MTKQDSQQKTITAKMAGESEQQYLAWLLYCESGSLSKLLRQWQSLYHGFGDAGSETAGGLRDKLGESPSERTLATWSKKYQWVARREIKLEEDIEALREKTKKIKGDKVHRIAEIFERSANEVLKQMKKGSVVTVTELKAIWEMFRTELGESIGKQQVEHSINESNQTPPNQEEVELGKALNDTIKNFYDKRGTKGKS